MSARGAGLPGLPQARGPPVLLVGGGRVAASKLPGLLARRRAGDGGRAGDPARARNGRACRSTGGRSRRATSTARGSWSPRRRPPRNRAGGRGRGGAARLRERRGRPRARAASTPAASSGAAASRSRSRPNGDAPALAGPPPRGSRGARPGRHRGLGGALRGREARLRRARVPMEERRPLLLAGPQPALRGAGAAVSGFVSLVGRGAGRPGPADAAAARRLAEADLVFYDALVSREALDLAPPRAAVLRGQARAAALRCGRRRSTGC